MNLFMCLLEQYIFHLLYVLKTFDLSQCYLRDNSNNKVQFWDVSISDTCYETT